MTGGRLAKLVAAALIALPPAGCQHARFSEERLVSVRIVGYVDSPGQHLIRSEFLPSSILAAAKPRADEMFGATRHFYLHRGFREREDGKIEGGTETRVPFEDMPEMRRQGWRFQDGDLIYIPQIIF